LVNCERIWRLRGKLSVGDVVLLDHDYRRAGVAAMVQVSLVARSCRQLRSGWDANG